MSQRFWEFFTAQIPNSNTRRAYYQAISQFSAWCHQRGVEDLARVEPMHVAAWVQDSGRVHSRPTVKQHLAAVRMLFDWMILGQFLPVNPAASVRGLKHTVKRGKTPVLSSEEMGEFLRSLPTDSVLGLRDRALLGVMAYTFARLGAVLNLKVEDYYVQRRRGWLRLQERGARSTKFPVTTRWSTSWKNTSRPRVWPERRTGRCSAPGGRANSCRVLSTNRMSTR